MEMIVEDTVENTAEDTAEDISEGTAEAAVTAVSIVSAVSAVSAVLKYAFTRTLYRTRNAGEAVGKLSELAVKVMISHRHSNCRRSRRLGPGGGVTRCLFGM